MSLPIDDPSRRRHHRSRPLDAPDTDLCRRSCRACDVDRCGDPDADRGLIGLLLALFLPGL